MRLAIIAAAATLIAAPASADLGDEPRIVEPLIGIGIAYEISEVCPGIDARKIVGLTRLLGLKGTARDLGYSDREIDAFIDDDAEKDRLEAVARERLAALGATRGDVEAHCAVGRAQIAEGGYVGQLLRD